MKAVTISRYGGPEVLEYRDHQAPKPKDNEVVVKVRASSVNPIDWRIREGELKMFIRVPLPFVLGVDLAGEIAEVGSQARRFSVGDPVFAMMPRDIGAHAELVAIPEELVARKPSGMTMEEAASVPAVALTALQSLRDRAQLRAGQRVLVNGASGGVGLFGVQIAKVLGASVTAVCSEANWPMVNGLGADRHIDYKKTDFTKQSEKYDVVFDAVANRSPRECAPILDRGGVYVSTGGTPGLFARQLVNFIMPVKVFAIIVKSKGTDLEWVREQIEKGSLKTVIDKVYPVTEVAEAQRYSKTGRAKGKIVLTL